MAPTIGSFTIVKNERPWIAAHLESWLPFLDEMVFYDGFSKDGTLEILKHYQANHEHGHKIKVFEGKDPADLRDAYVKMFDDCLHELSTDLAAFTHPDMILMEPGNIRNLDGGLSYAISLKSFAGEPGGPVFEIVEGRGKLWKNIYTLKPDLGLHYFGHYGAANEDCYYREITGDEHEHHGPDTHLYPYSVVDSGVVVHHYSDVRPYERRLGRMVVCMENQGKTDVREKALAHPRVTLKDGDGFKMVPSEYPAVFAEAEKKIKEMEAVSV